MKRFIFIVISCFFVIALTGRYSFAQMDGGVKMDEEMMKPMMEQMKADDMMKKEMMQMMMEMMDMQEKMLKGSKVAEKKQMMKDMAQMKEKMRKMMSMDMNMPGMDKTSGTQSKEAEGKEPRNAETPKTDPHQH
jgi:hypothetical protein